MSTKKYLINVAPQAIPQAVKPPALLNVVYQTYLNDAEPAKLEVCACLLKTTISIGVTNKAIDKLDANEAIRMLTN